MGISLNIIGDEKSSSGCSAAPKVNVLGEDRSVPATDFFGRAAIVTLGCAKNQVDSEVMLGVLRNSGYEIVSDVNRADVVIVNTCGFLESAVKESISCVLEVAELKEKGLLKKLIVAGCAVERYRKELEESLPEVDVFITLEDVLKVGDAARGGASAEFRELLNRAGRPYFLYDETMPRQISTGTHTAYVKISEGCNRPCAFCIIPQIRGEMRSRPIESVVKEVQALGAQGVQEVNLIAQDLTSFGKDRKGEDLAALLRAIDATGAVPWVRLLYAYPVGVNEDLLNAIVTLPSIVDYIDIPLQHVSESVLLKMRRPLGKFSPREIVRFIREKAPNIKIRTTFIVGFPGETDADAKELADFVSEGHFSSVGVFTYSKEKGTPAYDMEGQLSERVKNSRRKLVMEAQQKVVIPSLREYIGKRIEVLVEGAHEDSDLLLSGRARFQAPEVDGSVIINDMAIEGDFTGKLVEVEVTEVAGYDLVGSIVGLARDRIAA